MLTAREARRKVDELIKQREESVKKKVESAIINAVEKCSYSCSLNIYVSDNIKKYLESNGYKIERTRINQDNNTTIISW